MKEKEEKKDIWKALDTVSYSAKLGEHAGRSDQMFYKHLQEGIEHNDPDKIYEFIEACERGCGLASDELVTKLFQKAYEEDPERLCKTLAEKNSIVAYWIFLTTSCDTNMILSFTKMDVPYAYFYYECARILMKRVRTEVQCEEGVVAAVKKISVLDLSLWQRWLRKNEYNMLWQKLVFRVLENVSCEALRIYAQTIQLDMMTKRGELGIITQAFMDLQETSGNVLGSISSLIWDRWCLMIEKKKRKFVFLKEICITAYTDLVLTAFQDSLSGKEEWKSYLLKYGEIFNQDMYDWYESETKMCSIFFYDVTQIYYILFVGQRCEFIEVDDSICRCIRNIKTFIDRYDFFWEKDDGQKGKLENVLNTITWM